MTNITKRSEIAALSRAEYLERRDEIFKGLKDGSIQDDLTPSTPEGKDLFKQAEAERIAANLKELEGREDVEVYAPKKQVVFRASDVAKMSPQEFRESGARQAYAEGRIVDDVPRQPLGGYAVTITPSEPKWLRDAKDESTKETE